MSSSTLTTNFNGLSPTSFKLVIDHTKYANVEYFITTITIPDLSLGEIRTQFRGQMGYIPGEKPEYGVLNLRFMIDEDMKNYEEIYDWIQDNVTSKNITAADMTLSILTSHNTLSKEFQFVNAFPTSISGVEFSTQAQDVEYLQADVSFRYDRFVIL